MQYTPGGKKTLAQLAGEAQHTARQAAEKLGEIKAKIDKLENSEKGTPANTMLNEVQDSLNQTLLQLRQLEKTLQS